MKTMMKTIVLCTTLLTVLSACTPEKKKEPVKVQITVNEQMKADELTDAGEQLIAPHTFHLADRAFALALEKNPDDKKAQFYRAFLKRFMVFRGVVTNIRPMVRAHGDIKHFDTELKKLPNSPIADFLVVPEDKVIKRITTEEQAQELLIAYREALQDFRTFIATNSDLKLDLRLNPMVFMEKIQDNMANNCVILPGSSEEESKIECDSSDAAIMRLNVADLMVLKQAAAVEVLYLAFYTSYNANGAIAYGKSIDGQELTPQQRWELSSEKMDLKLLKRHGLAAVRSLGADLGIAAKWVMKYQDSVCPKNTNGQPLVRKGYLLTQGLCIHDIPLAERNLAILGQILSGPMSLTIDKADGTQVVKNLNLLAPFDRPPADLRKLAPATWTADGSKATSYKDKTLGGLFPDGDADSLIVIEQK